MAIKKIKQHIVEKLLIKFTKLTAIFSVIIVLLLWILIYLYYKFPLFKDLFNNLGSFYLFIRYVFLKFKFAITYPLITFGGLNITFLNLFLASIFFLWWFYIWNLYKKFIYKITKKNKNISQSTRILFTNLGYYTIIFSFVVLSLNSIWLNLSNLTLIAWALSVWIWFWLKNIVSNFVSGLIIMFEKSLKIWDYIELEDGTRWKITDIRMRYTELKTNDNIDIIIPNVSIIDKNIINWTLEEKKVRFRIPFWVAYGTDIKKLEKVIMNMLKESDLPYMKTWEYKPILVMRWMWNSSLDFWLYVWIRWDYIFTPYRTQSMFLKAIYNALNENGIVIPFPQNDLHIKDSVPIEVIVKK